ncbi:MAG TPA: SUF system NifU family Fe-S cluster assembly protein [Leptospiraceae bacterium]|nr:SUF system NifU family Fe-S cluster assembly protein [Leptospiraceae bacterium]HMY68091.1 SUF system NifU family Fe-S cluster assembly protein [Leptospiraceae bacterium]HNF13261.1 SUF system NifU family Fe-S cluster assembly protein [Leptospiraceae bacterium]HNF25506.1 SUF system NifU family Fe-S cluster assembly protein [Leptospiraceae bacterium]HNH09162.1 SUF system NifU family Fe-S cluster assembly protein [Leptospiraceae bacterium]
MSLKEDLYKEVILDHYENPRNYGVLNPCQRHEKGANPLCGDELELFLNFSGDVIESITFHGKGCSISQSSGSMMTELVKGKTKEEALAVMKKFKLAILEDKEQEFTEEEGDLESLLGVKKYPVRVKCAVLAWNTLERALN